MAITQNTFMEAGLKAKIDNYYAPQTIAILINDPSGTLTASSLMADVVALEIDDNQAYNRQTVVFPPAVITAGRAEAQSDPIVFEAVNFDISTFTHICFVLGGSTTGGDASTGIPDRIEPVNNGVPLSLARGESYIHSFLHQEEGNYL